MLIFESICLLSGCFNKRENVCSTKSLLMTTLETEKEEKKRGHHSPCVSPKCRFRKYFSLCSSETITWKKIPNRIKIFYSRIFCQLFFPNLFQVFETIICLKLFHSQTNCSGKNWIWKNFYVQNIKIIWIYSEMLYSLNKMLLSIKQ